MRGIQEQFPQERVIFGIPVAEALASQMDSLGAERVFIMCSGTLSRRTPVIDDLKSALGARFVGLFDEMPAHSPRTALLKAVEKAREAQPDLLLSVGGGSSIDGAKMVQLMLAEDVRAHEDFDAFHMRRAADGTLANPGFKRGTIRQIAVPTTLSGAEYTTTAGSVDDVRHKKDLYVGSSLVPISVILDPAVARHTEDGLWYSTAVRAIDHAVESIYSPKANPFTDATCMHGLRTMQEALRGTRKDRDDLDARLDALMAVWLSTTGMGRGQHGASHGISYSLAAIAHVPHGHCSCVLLPATLRFNKPATEERQALIAELLGRPGADAADALLELLRELGQPTTLREVGVTREQLPQIARTVVASGQASGNPRPVERKEDVMEILETAW
ncbi:iron-containing alcohol dehydrogenase [Acuticoccus sp.]|uniref:iron-containing alcohol dehydrogenase n=1 Tax=Acuticoccus sp. TaxID=1904378 RepID=UPI003B520F94